MARGTSSCGGRGGGARSPDLVRAPDLAVAIFDAGAAVFAKEGRAVEVDDVTLLADDERRSHRKTGADHVADHHAEAMTARFLSDQQRLCQPATFVELA